MIAQRSSLGEDTAETAVSKKPGAGRPGREERLRRQTEGRRTNVITQQKKAPAKKDRSGMTSEQLRKKKQWTRHTPVT